MTKELLQQALDEAKADAIYVFTYAEGISAASKDAIEYMHSWLTVYFDKQALAQQEQPSQDLYPLPDSLYPGSKDWQAGSYKERVEWLHLMYESERLESIRLENVLASIKDEPAQQEQPAMTAQTVSESKKGVQMSCCDLSVFMYDFNYYFPRFFDTAPTEQQLKMARSDWRAGNTGYESAHNAKNRAKDAAAKALEKPF